MSDIVDQPPPVARPDLTPIWEQIVDDVEARYPRPIPWEQPKSLIARVVADMRERDQLGRARYGVPLTAHNGRDQLVDLYQELLDGAAYARAAMLEGNVGLADIYYRLLDDIVNVRSIIDARDLTRKIK